jgi:ATP-binding cassette subfamily B protein
VFRYFMRMSVIGISRHIEYDLRNDVFAHLQRLPLQWFQSRRTGDIMARSINDLSAVRMMVGPGLMYLVNTVTIALVAVGFMLAISPRLTLWSLAPLPLVSLSMWWFGDRIHRRFEGIQAQFALLSARVQENLAGVRVVRAFARERRELADFEALNHDYLRQSVGLIRTSGLFNPSLAFFFGLAQLMVLYVGGREVVAGRVTLGQFVAFTVYLGMLNWPMVALGWVVNLFQRGNASFERLVEILDSEPAIAGPPDGARPPRIEGRVAFRGLTFTYPGADRPALREVTLEVPPGHTVAFVGRTGSGKSTLLALLPRLFDPPPGTVFVDGIDVRRWDLAELRRAIAVVPQESFLFSATVAENLAYGSPDAGPAEIARAAAVAGLEDDLRRFPDGFGTRVGERGITLSGGQRQRASLARALLRGSPILLLDDCLSSVDTDTEERILHGLRPEMRRRTTLIVSHRLSTVRDADLIVVFEDGAVVERGTHGELLARGGAYAALHREQQLEAEIEAS